MPVFIDGGPTTLAHSNIRRYDLLPPAQPSRVVGPGPPNALDSPSFELGLGSWQGTSAGWDAATVNRAFAVPMLFVSTPTTGTNGTTPTTSDAVPDTWQGFLIDSVATLTYSTTAPIKGSVSYVAAAGGGSNRAYARKGGFSGFDHQYIRAYYNKDTAPAVNQTIVKSYLTYNSGTQGLSIRVNTSSKFEVINAANAVVVTSSSSIPINKVFRLLIEVTASTGVGNLSLWLTNNGDNATPDEVIPFSAGANAFGATLDEWNFGNCGANNVTGTLKFGGISISYVDPGAYEAGEVSGQAIAAHDGKWMGQVVLGTGSQETGALYKIVAGSLTPGFKYLFTVWAYVGSGNPDVHPADVGVGTELWKSPNDSTKDAWVKQSVAFTSSASGDQFVGVSVPTGSHTAGQIFYVDDASLRLWTGPIENKSVEENLNGWTPNYFTWDTSTITRSHTVNGHTDDWAIKVAYPTPTTSSVCANKSAISSSGSNSVVSAAFTPAVGELLLVAWNAEWDGTVGLGAITDSWGLTWTLIDGLDDGGFFKFGVWWARATSATSGTVTVTGPTTAATRRHALRVDGVTASDGFTPVLQSVFNDSAFAATVPVNLPAAPISTSLVWTAHLGESSTTPTVPTGFTSVGSTANPSSTGRVTTAYKNGSVAQNNSWTGSPTNQTLAVAAEIHLASTANGYSGLTYFAPDEDGLVVGHTYTFGIWVFVPTGSPDVCAEVQFVAVGPTVTTKNAWTLATVTAVFTSVNQAIGVRNAVNNSFSAGQFFYADDASLTDNGIVLPTGSGFFVLL